MSAQLRFTQSDIYSLPFREGDTVKYREKEVIITSIYLREFNEAINDIIVTFSDGDYTFHDDYELKMT